MPKVIEEVCRTNSVDELVSLYSSADVVMSLSKGDTLASTPLEGMACETPVIVYDNTAQPKLVTLDTGIVVDQGNTGKLREAVLTINANGKNCYSDACRCRVEVLYKEEKQYMKYNALYDQLCFWKRD